MDADTKCRVVARIRPKTRKEIGERISITRHDDYVTLRVSASTEDDLEDVRESAFRFDAVYNEDDDQVTLYEEECADIVDHCLVGGMPATVLAYGQTGSGKTFSILGRTGADGGLHGDSGVFLRVFCDIFRSGIQAVTLSVVELYLDEVYDLLDERAKRRVRVAGADNIVVQNMKEVSVSTLDDVLQIFAIANDARSVTATHMNEESSRSHAIFIITIPPRPEQGLPNPTRLMLVDLAGSERIKKSKAEGGAVAEAAAINKTLSTLGTVVHAMYTNSSHVPFRDSELTKLLRSSFVHPQCRLLIIGQFSPVVSNAPESISTAKFCDRVKGLSAASNAFGGGAGAMSSADPQVVEENRQMLATLREQAELAAELRVARASIGLELPQSQEQEGDNNYGAAVAVVPTRKSMKPAAISVATTAARLQNPFAPAQRYEVTTEGEAELLRAEIEADIHAMEQAASLAALQRCEALKQRTLQQHRARVQQARAEFEELQQKTTVMTTATEQFDGGRAAEADEHLKAAKRSKKKRVQLEEKAQALHERHTAVRDELSVTPENYVLPPSLVDFDADDDPDAELAEKRAECNHAIVSDFYSHWRTVQRLYGDVIGSDSRAGEIRVEMHNIARDQHLDQQYLQAGGATGAAAALVSREDMILAGHWIPNPLLLDAEFPKQPVEDEHLILCSRIPEEDEIDLSQQQEQQQQQQQESTASAPMAAPAIAAFSVPPPNRLVNDVVDEDLDFSSSADDDVEFTIEPSSGGGAMAHPAGAAAAASTSKAAAPSGSSSPDEQNRPQLQRSSAAASMTADAFPPIPGATSSSSTATTTLAAANTNQGAGTAAGGKGGVAVRRKKTPEEIALAEKHYLMGIYDSRTLVTDIVKFLTNGTRVLKHGRAGQPHQRHAWVRDSCLFWIDPDPANAGSRVKHHIPLAGVGSIVLGPFSKVFKRYPVPPSDPTYFLSFTIHMSDGSRSVDFVADNLVDFEAWVIGLVNLCRVDCVWGKPLKCAEIEPTEYHELDAFEKALCDRENLLPSIFHRVRAKVIEIRNDIAMHMRAFRGNSEQAFQTMGRDGIHQPQMSSAGAVLMTKGELRYHCSQFNVCIFRVCRLFEYFRDVGIIFDNEYSPICKFGVTSRS